jgi:hypothetical protein
MHRMVSRQDVYVVVSFMQPGTGAGTALGLGAAAWDSALVLAAYIATLPAEALQGGCSRIPRTRCLPAPTVESSTYVSSDSPERDHMIAALVYLHACNL